MQAIMSLGLGYLIGSISPAALLGRIKHVNLKEEGTGNLGATNTAFVLGKASGIFVMIFDILKSFFSAKLAKLLFPHLLVAGMIACIGAILGHCFPVFLHFQGGKGLAAFGGMVLAYKPLFFLQIIIPGIVLMLITDSGAVMPALASILFPSLVWLHRGDIAETLLAILAGVILIAVHWTNLQNAKHKNDSLFVREFFKKVFHKE